MQHKVIGILSLLVCSFLFAAPASAVDLPLCAAPDGSTHFTLVAQDQAIFESSDVPKTIFGNVLVTNGFVKLGKNINITGTVIAASIEFHSSGTSSAGACVAGAITGKPVISTSGLSCFFPGAAGGLNPPTTPGGTHTALDFSDFQGTHDTCVASFANPPVGPPFSSLCGPTPVIAPCANTAKPLIVNENDTLTLPDDLPLPDFPVGTTCFGALTLNKAAVLKFTDNGVYTFKQVRMKSGAQLNGPATVNVNGQFITEGGVFITDINLNIASSIGDVVAIFNNSILSGVVINAPFGRCHPHTGTSLVNCSELCCKTLDIEPINATCVPGREFCVCPQGFKFENPWQVPPPFNEGPITGDLQDARNCVRCAPGDNPLNGFPTCP